MENATTVLKPYPLGWKAKVGVLMPAVDTGYCSYEFRTLCPDGVVTLETRVRMGALTLENLQNMRGDAVHGAKLVASAVPDVITYEATAAGFVLGVDGDAALIREIEEATGIRATTGASSVAASLEALGAKQISVYAATPKEVTDYTVRYLTDRGFSVRQQFSLSFGHASDCFRMSPWEIYGEVLKFHRKCPDVDAVFISGGCFRTLEMIAALEKEIGIPVVTTVPANMFNCLAIARVNDPVIGFGRLLEMPRPDKSRPQALSTPQISAKAATAAQEKSMPTPLDKVMYTAEAHVTGGRDGAGRTSDGALEVKLSRPASGQPGTNPEQLFAIGYAACFLSAMKAVGAKINIKAPDDTMIDSSVSLGPTRGGAAFGLAVKLSISLPGLDPEQKKQLIAAAHEVCPYSNATRGNIAVELAIL